MVGGAAQSPTTTKERPEYVKQFYETLTLAGTRSQQVILWPIVNLLIASVLTLWLSLKTALLNRKIKKLQQRYHLQLAESPAYAHIDIPLFPKIDKLNLWYVMKYYAISLYQRALEKYENAKSHFEQQQALCLYRGSQMVAIDETLLERPELEQLLQDNRIAPIVFVRETSTSESDCDCPEEAAAEPRGAPTIAAH